MPTLDRDGVAVNYIDEGDGPPVVLVHGFASSLEGNWRGPGVIDALKEAGRRVIALDCRGHGRSAKPKDPAAYAGTAMADDVVALMDARGVERCPLVGYSMGAFLSVSLLVRFPERFPTVVLGGVGDRLLAGGLGGQRNDAIARAMEAPDAGAREDAVARGFRIFAERTGNDLQALAAMQRATRARFDAAELRETKARVLVLVGDRDDLVGSGERLAAAIPGARLVKVAGDHLTAVVNPAFRAAIVEFLRAV